MMVHPKQNHQTPSLTNFSLTRILTQVFADMGARVKRETKKSSRQHHPYRLSLNCDEACGAAVAAFLSNM